MSREFSAGLPSTTVGGIVVASVVGTGALAVFEPMVLAGVACGLALAMIHSWFGGRYRRLAVATLLLPVVVFVSVAVVGLTGELIAGALVAVAVLVWLATGRLTGRRSPLDRTKRAMLYTGVLTFMSAFAVLVVAEEGGFASGISELLWLPGQGVIGLMTAVSVAAFVAVCGLFALPPAAFVPPAKREAYQRVRATLGFCLVGGVLLTAVVVGLLWLAALFVPPFESLFRWVVDGPAVRGASLAVTIGGFVLVAFGAVVRQSWATTDGRENVAVVVLAGGTFGSLAPFVLVPAGLPAEPIAVAAGATGTILIAGWLVISVYSESIGSSIASSPAPTIVAFGLVLGGVTAASSLEVVNIGVVTARTAAVSLTAIAAGLFVYDVGRYGSVLSREVGRENTTGRPQFVRLGWSAVVAGVGVPVAGVGVVIAAVLAPTLSVPATAAVVTALGAVVVGGWLLFD